VIFEGGEDWARAVSAAIITLGRALCVDQLDATRAQFFDSMIDRYINFQFELTPEYYARYRGLCATRDVDDLSRDIGSLVWSQVAMSEAEPRRCRLIEVIGERIVMATQRWCADHSKGGDGYPPQ
jgi:hypothetical protein